MGCGTTEGVTGGGGDGASGAGSFGESVITGGSCLGRGGAPEVSVHTQRSTATSATQCTWASTAALSMVSRDEIASYITWSALRVPFALESANVSFTAAILNTTVAVAGTLLPGFGTAGCVISVRRWLCLWFWSRNWLCWLRLWLFLRFLRNNQILRHGFRRRLLLRFPFWVISRGTWHITCFWLALGIPWV